MKIFKVAQHPELIFIETNDDVFFMRKRHVTGEKNTPQYFIETHFKEMTWSDKKVLKYLEKEEVTPEEAIQFLNWCPEAVMYLFMVAFEAIIQGKTDIEIVSCDIF